MIRLLSILLCVSSVLAAELPLLTPAPPLTGKPGHPAWNRARKILFPQKDTWAFLGRTQNHLYIAVRSSHGSINDRICTLTAHDAPVYMNDSLDVFINTSGKKDFFQIISNVNGAVFDQYRDENGTADLTWDSGTIAKGSYGKNSFYIEMKIPLASLAPLKEEFSLMVSSYQRWRLKGVQILGRPHRPETFTKFKTDRLRPVKLLSLETPAFSGSRIFSYTLQNTGKKPLSLTGCCGREQFTLKLAPLQTKVLKVPVTLDGGRENIVTLILKDKKNEVLRVTRYLKVRKALEASLRSDLLYNDEPVPLLIKVNEKQDIPVEVEYLPGKVRCSYKGETVELPYKRIPSPWKN